MQRTLLASVIIMTLSACDGVSLSNEPLKNDLQTPNTTTTDSVDTNVDTNADTTSTDGTTDSNTDASSNSDQSTSGPNWISDDAASSTSDGGQSSSTNTDTDSSTDTDTNTDTDDSGGKYEDDDETDGDFADDLGDKDYDDADNSNDNGDNGDNGDNDSQIDDDAASGTSDGGEIDDDAASGTSDGGEIDDDAASGTSDGGEIDDDAASGTSDGGQPDDNSVDNTNTETPDQNTDGGEFVSDNIGGTVIRRSTLAASTQQEICTTASAEDNFSDTRVGDFILHNNVWRPWRVFPNYQWSQCINTNTNDAVIGWSYDWGPGQTGINGNPNASGDFYVRSYPELIYGVKDEFRTSAPKSVTGFPVELSEMPNISIDYSYDGPQYGEPRIVDASNNSRFPNGTTISGERNVSIESFFYNKDAAGQCSEDIVKRSEGSNHVYEVMVWLDAGAERLPAGPGDFVVDLNIRGADYKVYTKNADPRYIAFVAQNPQTTGTIYWNDFTDWAKNNAHQVQQQFGARSNSVQIQDDWCVANIIVGTEIFWGAGNFNMYDWTITQSQ